MLALLVFEHVSILFQTVHTPLVYGRYGYDYKRNNILSLIQNNQITMEEIVQLMRENDCQYLVWKYDEEKIAEAEALGGSVVGRTDSYVIIKLENVQGK